MSTCRSCGAALTWVQTEAGKAMPLDAVPHPDGNVEMTGRWERSKMGATVPVVRVVVPQASLFGDEAPTRYLPHFATCPQADEHRQRGVNEHEVGGAPSRHDHPETSVVAAKKVRIGSQHAAIILDLSEAPMGRTAFELANLVGHLTRKRPGISPNQAGSRIAELRDRGLVEVLEVDGAQVTRRAAASDALVHVLTPRGRVEVGRLRSAQVADQRHESQQRGQG